MASAPSEPDPEPEIIPVPTATTTSSTTSTTLALDIAAPVLASKKPVDRTVTTACKKIGLTKKVAKTTYRCAMVKQVAMWQTANKKVVALKK